MYRLWLGLGLAELAMVQVGFHFSLVLVLRVFCSDLFDLLQSSFLGPAAHPFLVDVSILAGVKLSITTLAISENVYKMHHLYL